MSGYQTAAAEDFAGRVIAVLNSGALALMVSIGHRSGLFDAMASLPQSTSAEIASVAGLNERYVREWLGAMVTGGIVDVDGSSRLYHLPPNAPRRSRVRPARTTLRPSRSTFRFSAPSRTTFSNASGRAEACRTSAFRASMP